MGRWTENSAIEYARKRGMFYGCTDNYCHLSGVEHIHRGRIVKGMLSLRLCALVDYLQKFLVVTQ